MSEAELDAVISQLRTDKNLVVPPAPVASTPWGAMTERLVRGTTAPLGPTELAAAREEAARHAWFVALDEQVVGPLGFAALRTHWDEGELGPDSLCWRKGFEDWQPMCRVPGLSELLAPKPPDAAVSATDLVPGEHLEDLGFELKGAEALRELGEATPPPIGPELSSSLAPFLDPEPVTVPAALSALELMAHPVIPPAPVEVRIRGAVWLALGGGLVGGVLVALFLWGLGPRNGWGPSVHSGPTLATAPVSATAREEVLPAVEAPKPVAGLPVSGLGTGAAFGGVSAPPVTFWNPDLATAAGGIAGPVGTSASLPLLPSPVSAPLETVPAPRPAAVTSRPEVKTPPLRKLAKVEVALEPEAPAEVVREAPPVEEESVDEELGLDEDFERELSGPPSRSKGASGRTVWIPPEPTPAGPVASLAQSDVFAVVLANKGDIASCASAGKSPQVEEGQRVVVRWTIAPSGKVTEVVTESAGFKGTPLASCLEGKIRAWTFPKHREQGGPVRFPFVF
ncbi:GYF domain-containing protein [Hyalangium rubrum]|uniref:GYF domain-containing protein n=1 Tax=Hyalangium rubrum TaxID=3103134 RepID=A0ABU5H591_9BACT|nr:GYF domain-containing protein [Hyalangium sp. s54d21]MDY7227968.1 GYF domain-containing protein [Hyalangium sp. s54d21]